MLTRIQPIPGFDGFDGLDCEMARDIGFDFTPHQLRAELPRPPSGGGGHAYPVHPKFFKTLGTGEVGDKVRQLEEVRPALVQVGLDMPPGNVITEDQFAPILRRLGLGNSLAEADQHPDACARIKEASINTDEVLWLIAAMEGMPREHPIVVRSSAVDDAEGSGTYASFFVPGNFVALGQAVLNVLASYFTEDARTFRRLCGAQYGLGILVMPALVQELSTITPSLTSSTPGPSVLAPILSGSGVTSNHDGEAEVWAVPGLSGGDGFGYSEPLTSSRLKLYEGQLARYVRKESLKMIGDIDGRGSLRISSLLQTDQEGYQTKPYYRGRSLADLHSRLVVVDTNLLIIPNDVMNAIPMLDFLDRLKNLECILGYRAYVEWAVRIENGQPQFTILQIARADFKGDIIELEKIANPLFSAHSVYGFRKNERCSAVVYCSSLDDINNLCAFDAAHPEGYVLVYDGDLKYRGGPHSESPLTISVVPHAVAIYEKPGRGHMRLPISHWAGQIEKTGKIFGVMADTELPDSLRARMTSYQDSGLLAYDGPVIVNASARQGSSIVSLPTE